MFLRPAAADFTFHHAFDGSFHPEGHIHMDQDGVDQDDSRRCVDQQTPADHPHREVVCKVRTPDDDPGGKQHKDHAHNAPEHHFLSGVVFTDTRHMMLITFQHFDNVFNPRQIFSFRDVVLNEAEKHKHQHDENQHTKERVQNTPHCRRPESFRQPLQCREEQRNTG